MKYRSMVMVFSWAVMMLVCIEGCAKKIEYNLKPENPPPMKNCVEDACPSREKPFIMGGRDYSPPTIKNIARWQKAGYFTDKTWQEIQEIYKDKGYDWYEDDLPCNCLCRGTAHAAFGGKCLEAPVPGTPEYEAFVLGENLATNKEK
ncbi:MAG: hypothetical protein C4523_20830 [Myxococcales bacterium]|nr:MAG: hypothetical protein C4523_20830 [Myxococcales bacterium]